MKNSLFLTLILIGFIIAMNVTSCDDNQLPKAPIKSRLELDSTSRYSDQNYKIYRLEGCEYVVVGFGSQRWGSHKGNCKNPIHKQ